MNEIDLGEYTGFHRVYDYQPYTFHRIKRILAGLDMRLENIYQGYKANRRPGYCELYRVIRISDNVVINPCISLEQIRHVLARNDFPLEDEKSMTHTAADTSGLSPSDLGFLKLFLCIEQGNE